MSHCKYTCRSYNLYALYVLYIWPSAGRSLCGGGGRESKFNRRFSHTYAKNTNRMYGGVGERGISSYGALVPHPPLSFLLLCVCVDVDASQVDGVDGSYSLSGSLDVPMSDIGQSVHEEEEEELTKNDAWHVITAYFDEKGLVRQQLDR